MSDTTPATEGTRILLDYTSRDFAAIRTQMVGLAKGLMPDWQTAGESGDFGTLLLELFAYMGDVMNFYIDRAASEAFLGTALRRQSVLYIADMFGYKAVGQHSATVGLLFDLDEKMDEKIVIPAGARIYNETRNSADTIVFELDAPITLDPDPAKPESVRKNVQGWATEGIMVYDNLLGLSLGGPALDLTISEKGVVAHTVLISSREGGQIIEWTEVSDISLGRPTQSVFTTYMDDYDNTHVLFGDNAAGRIPPVNAEIFGTYRIGVGVEANSLLPGDLKVISSTSELSDKLWAVTVRNPNAPVGGTDPESTDSMRFSIPRAAGRIKNRAITLNDYADLALQVPGVAKSTAYGTLYTSIHVRIAPTGGVGDATTMERLCAQVESYLSDKILVGSGIVAEPEDLDLAPPAGLWQNVHLRFVVHVQPAYNRTAVRTEVDRVIRETLAFDAVDFGTRVSIGLMYRSALAVQGVEWVDLNWLSTTIPTEAQEEGMDEDDDFQSVNEIITDSLYIPRIYQYPPAANFSGSTVLPGMGDGEFEVIPAGVVVSETGGTIIEPEADFPDMTEEERTHDGLWVKAVGGLVST